MILPDVNVLLYAFRKDAADHAKYRSWLDSVVNGDAAYGISPQVLSSVIRIATHPRIFKQPSRLEEVIQFCDVLLNQSQSHRILPGSLHWAIFCKLCRQARAVGNLVQDAWFAALAIESACDWITTDGDYGRFPGLRWRSPF